MKKVFILLLGTILMLSCDVDQLSNSDFEDENSVELKGQIRYVDGERITVYSDKTTDDLKILNGNDYVSLSDISGKGDLTFYLNGELNDFLIFTSKDKMINFIENPHRYNELMAKIKGLDPSMIREVDKGPSVDASGPSFTIATAHSLGGYTFTKALPYPSRYGNPHLRCNQYETGCINFNDEISSFRLSAGVSAEFYSGSFPSPGARVYAQGPVQVNNLQDSGWNDRITSFWASTASTYETNLNIIFPGNTTCGHNYDDPACGSSGGGGSGGGGIQ
ncbi:hypothetical protein [Flagellimonas lutimaris]|uniref:hypothetical protein n=1 Tax=Flagellimonas lutimaris TaxID=475082 RepID=UPI003F5CD59F